MLIKFLWKKKLEYLYITGGNIKWYRHSFWKAVWQFLKKLNTELPHGTAISLSTSMVLPVLDIPYPDENILELDNGDGGTISRIDKNHCISNTLEM